jgi:hypothetical protein
MSHRTPQQSESSRPIYQSLPKSWYTHLLRTIGYVLLLLVVLDLIAMLIPLRLMDPTWEFQRFGELVEQVAVPLLAIVLIFYGEEWERGRLELRFLQGLSWCCLGFGILLLALMPLSFSDAQRITIDNHTQLSSEYSQKMDQSEQVEKLLRQGSSEDLNTFLVIQGRSSEGNDPKQVREQLLADLTQTRQKLKDEYNAKQDEQRLKLLKNAVKWNIGALVSGILFIYIWRLTRWVRKKY